MQLQYRLLIKTAKNAPDDNIISPVEFSSFDILILLTFI